MHTSQSSSRALKLTQVAVITNPSPGILARFHLREVTWKNGSRNECYTLQKKLRSTLSFWILEVYFRCVMLHFAAILFSANVHDALHATGVEQERFYRNFGRLNKYHSLQRPVSLPFWYTSWESFHGKDPSILCWLSSRLSIALSDASPEGEIQDCALTQ